MREKKLFENKRDGIEGITSSYERAAVLEKGIYTKRCALNTTLFPIWINDSDCFWYERETKEGREYRLVDAAEGSNNLAFDHLDLALKLKEASGETIDEINLPITDVSIEIGPRVVEFCAFHQYWRYSEASKSIEKIQQTAEDDVISPDGHFCAFTKDYNIWIRDRQNGEERQLTKDGIQYFVYGRGGTVWGPNAENFAGVQVRWSPDSRQLLTVQRDSREVSEIPVIHHVPMDGSLKPKVEYVKSASPGDEAIETYRLLSINVVTGEIQRANYSAIPVVRIGWGFFDEKRGWWGPDSRRAYFIDQARGDQIVRLVEFDTQTGHTRVLFEEASETHINLASNNDEFPALIPLMETNELLWFSERSGWAHLYLYDLDTGRLKHPVTQGDWLVRDVIYFDAKRREIYLQTAGREQSKDPYYRDLVRVCIDTGTIFTLMSTDHDYFTMVATSFNAFLAKLNGRDIANSNGVSPSGQYAVVTRSRADEIPESLLIDREGRISLCVEKADISPLQTALSNQWQWPEPVKLLADDNKTEIYGLVFRPSDFDASKSYPVVSHVFRTPELPFVSKGSFSNGSNFGHGYFSAAALAELGFIVVQIDGRGTPCRDKKFHDASYGWAPSASMLEDHIAGIKQLADRYPYMDLERVGITGHMAGGPSGVQALLEHPEFYKVGVNFSAHDSRFGMATVWGDKYEGVSGPKGGHRYPEDLVDNLQGKLLIMHGMLYSGNGFPVTTTFRLIDALQKANKDFDLLLLPNLAHAYDDYLTRRTWDYLVTHLLKLQPPKEFHLVTIFTERS